MCEAHGLHWYNPESLLSSAAKCVLLPQTSMPLLKLLSQSRRLFSSPCSHLSSPSHSPSKCQHLLIFQASTQHWSPWRCQSLPREMFTSSFVAPRKPTQTCFLMLCERLEYYLKNRHSSPLPLWVQNVLPDPVTLDVATSLVPTVQHE